MKRWNFTVTKSDNSGKVTFSTGKFFYLGEEDLELVQCESSIEDQIQYKYVTMVIMILCVVNKWKMLFLLLNLELNSPTVELQLLITLTVQVTYFPPQSQCERYKKECPCRISKCGLNQYL